MPEEPATDTRPMMPMTRLIATAALAGAFVTGYAVGQPAKLDVKTLLQTNRAWDGNIYPAYPDGQPQVSVLEITIPAKTAMDWHQHPMPNVGYVVAGEIRVETKDGQVAHFRTGQIIPETVTTVHRGVTAEQPVKLLVFYAGATGLPLSQVEPK
jgi:quercetin dioxygenase-like cupin family protein